MENKVIVGIDVSKDWLDVAIAGRGQVERIANTPEAVAGWAGRVEPGWVAFEPTGGYERILRDGLREHGIAFVRIHPNDVIAFRKSRAIKAKTDRLDAKLIAAFAAEELTRRGLEASIVGDDTLRELAARRRQLVDARHAERCRGALAQSEGVKASLELVGQAIDTALCAVEAELAGRIAADPAMARRAGLLRTLKGIGPVSATTLIADLPELGHLSGKEIASLVGLAPRTRQSGKSRNAERSSMGRPSIRRVLFNAARAAIRHNPPMRAFYERLVVDNRRPGKVALVAVMRKMLVTLSAIARDNEPWRGAAAA
jgi:transposase